PFSHCFNGLEKRTLTHPFNHSRASYSCRTGLLHGVDLFNMTGRVYLNDVPRNAVIDVKFGVAPRNDNISVTILGTEVIFRYRDCLPFDPSVINSCGCLGVDLHGFRVVCTFLASLEHSQKFGYFQMFIDGKYYRGDFVRMPLVL
ncbi:unnamed protein product, partial [Lymnaea stagnalis]